MAVIVFTLSVAAAFLYALSDFLQQRAASRAMLVTPHESPTGRLRAGRELAGRLVREPGWFLGWVIGTFGFLLQAVALHFGSVAVVQAIIVTNLLFALPLSVAGTHQRPRSRDWLGGISLCVGLAFFLLVRGGAPTAGQANRGRIALLLVVLGFLLVALICVGLGQASDVARAATFAIGAGVAFACTATLIKLTAADLLSIGITGTATDWPGYALAMSTGIGIVLEQAAFAWGRLPTAVIGMTVTNPLIGTAIAAYGFGEGLPIDPAGVTAILFSSILLVAGLVVLANSPLLLGARSVHPVGGPGTATK